MRTLLLLLAALLPCACTTRYYPTRPGPSPTPAEYAAVINLHDPRPDLSKAVLISSVRTIDRGYSRDCAYAEIVEKIRRKAMHYGANLVLVTAHRPPESDHRSECSRISAQLYAVGNLAGQEASIFWSPARPLAVADLRAKPGGKVPPVHCNIKYRLLGNFYSEMIVRTITTFAADSTGMPDGPETETLGLRRAQLQFNMAETEARKFKQKMEALAPDVRAMTNQAKTLQENAKQAWQDRKAGFDGEFVRAGNQSAMLDQWEQTVNTELEDLSRYAGDYTIKLQSKKQH